MFGIEPKIVDASILLKSPINKVLMLILMHRRLKFDDIEVNNHNQKDIRHLNEIH